jgi:hypothetical protein
MGFFIYPFSFIFFVVKFWSEERIYLVIEEQDISSYTNKNKTRHEERERTMSLRVAVIIFNDCGKIYDQ